MPDGSATLPPEAPDSNFVAQAERILGLLDASDEKQPPPDGGGAGLPPLPETPPPAAASEESEAKEPPAEKEAEPPKTYRVKVRGEDLDVTLDDLMRGYSRTEDYKAKTAEIAETRRDYEARKQAVEAERQRYAQSLNQVVSYARSMDPILAEAAKTDWVKLASEDPATWAAKQAAVQQRMAQLQQFEQELAAATERNYETLRAEQRVKLAEKLPDFADAEKAKKLSGEIKEHLTSYGYSAEEIGGVVDHRAILVARDAARWREHEAGLKRLAEKRAAEVPPKTIRPTASAEKPGETARVKALKSQAIRSGRPSDAVNAVLAQLDSE